MFVKISLAAALLSSTAQPADTDTLREALAQTYQTNPTLTGQRESLKATDALVEIARAGGRPTVTGTVGVTRDISQSGVLQRTSQGPFLNGRIDANMPLFQGGTVRNDIKAAKMRVEAGRATLRAVEGDIFVEAVGAYMDVMRDRAVVELNRNQVDVLNTNLQAAGDRFEIGDVTRTDVAQSDARLQLAQSRLATAEGNLAASEENYRRIIGDTPGALAPPPPLPPFPATADAAVRVALADNPDLIALARQAEAAGYDVGSAMGSRLPTVSANASGQYINTLAGDVGGNPFTGQSNPRTATSTSVGLSARVPLFQGGLPSARVARARALEGQTFEQLIATERAVISNTRSAFARYEAAQRAIVANQTAVEANSLALEGARLENSIGTRTILDVLNAEQELLNTQVDLVTAQRNAYVAGFQLLNAMGQAEADDLGLDGGPLYDPLGNYRDVSHTWWDWSGGQQNRLDSTRTVLPGETPENPIVDDALLEDVTDGQ
ncbi:TolC family outer membrane protein [Sphingomicrobium flavum]|uniref:TolC family outer membrane protein n=1 Tax=Sphingomicrobium flavum TaxID=1229164 RepID=UPI0021ADE78D|nr:TolC family outer membrane protein [Sphingomicrobium flavum]